MSSRPLLLHALSAPRRSLRTQTCIRPHFSQLNRTDDSRRMSSTMYHSLRPPSSLFQGQNSAVGVGTSCLSNPTRGNPPISSYIPSITTRSFASRRRKGPNGKNNKASSVLSNEELVGQIIRDAGVSSADKVTVRLVIDEGPDTPSSVEVISLSEAIELSLDRELDLIAANISGDPPVIRATQLSKLEYKHKQAQKKQQQAASNKKELKSFRFRAGIEANDLERKLDRLKSFLTKGHDCEFTVFTKMRMLRQNPDAGIELVDRISELLSDYGEMKRKPTTNETKSFYRVQYEPKK